MGSQANAAARALRLASGHLSKHCSTTIRRSVIPSASFKSSASAPMSAACGSVSWSLLWADGALHQQQCDRGHPRIHFPSRSHRIGLQYNHCEEGEGGDEMEISLKIFFSSHIYSFAMITCAKSKKSVFSNRPRLALHSVCAISVKCSLESWVVVHPVMS